MREIALCLPIRANQVLLGLKKTGFGKGNVVGIGGGIEPGETPEQAALRELHEEAGLLGDPAQLLHQGEITFLFPTRQNWDMHVQVFVLKGWQGEPAETHEIAPQWYGWEALPYHLMWNDSQHWLLRMLQGEHLKLQVCYQEDLGKAAIEFIP